MSLSLLLLDFLLGMALLSTIMAKLLRHSGTGLPRMDNGLQAVVGVATLEIGSMMIYDIGISRGLLV